MTDHNLYTIIPYKNKFLKFKEALSARVYYKNHYIDLLTGESHRFEIEGWLSELDFSLYGHNRQKRIIHLFYELGFLFEGGLEEVSSSTILGIDIEYGSREFIQLNKKKKKINLSLIEAPHFSDYQKQFNAGYEELLSGNCYQFNLTGLYRYRFDEEYEPLDFISALWSRNEKCGAYASATWCSKINLLFLSNSPECLFQYQAGKLITRPIKGTQKIMGKKTKAMWSELSRDQKSQAELFMITDLLRNDLNRIDLPTAKVTKKKAPLIVPGLLHQYSEVEIDLSPRVTLKKILENIFPGGSITGAPKKRVMGILKKLESRNRGFYCGSTLIFSKNSLAASINIRSSVIDFHSGELSYQAGGGITLLSEAKSEFLEMTYKHDSYIDTLTL